MSKAHALQEKNLQVVQLFVCGVKLVNIPLALHPLPARSARQAAMPGHHGCMTRIQVSPRARCAQLVATRPFHRARGVMSALLVRLPQQAVCPCARHALLARMPQPQGSQCVCCAQLGAILCPPRLGARRVLWGATAVPVPILHASSVLLVRTHWLVV